MTGCSRVTSPTACSGPCGGCELRPGLVGGDEALRPGGAGVAHRVVLQRADAHLALRVREPDRLTQPPPRRVHAVVRDPVRPFLACPGQFDPVRGRILYPNRGGRRGFSLGPTPRTRMISLRRIHHVCLARRRPPARPPTDGRSSSGSRCARSATATPTWPATTSPTRSSWCSTTTPATTTRAGSWRAGITLDDAAAHLDGLGVRRTSARDGALHFRDPDGHGVELVPFAAVRRSAPGDRPLDDDAAGLSSPQARARQLSHRRPRRR